MSLPASTDTTSELESNFDDQVSRISHSQCRMFLSAIQ